MTAARCPGCDLKGGDHTEWCRIAHPYESSAAKKQEVVRENHYYGGTIYVEPEFDSGNERVRIVWESWGDYGAAEISLDIDETKKLAEALMRVYDGAPEWVYKEDDQDA